MSLNETNYLSGTRNVLTNQSINRISTISKTGTNISSFPTSIGVPLLRCVEDGAGYKQNRVYVLRADNSGYESLFPQHTHSSVDVFNEGGSLYDILTTNSTDVLDTGLLRLKENWGSSGAGYTLAGTATFANEHTGASLHISGSTGTTTADYFNWHYGGLRIDFSSPFVFKTKLVLSHNTSVVFRYGVNGTLIQSVAGGQSQVIMEGCSSSSVNLQLRTGNGTTSTILPNTGSSMTVSANPTGYKIEYLPISLVAWSFSTLGVAFVD